MADFIVAVKGLTDPIVIPNVASAGVDETGNLAFSDTNGPMVVYAAGQWLHCGDLAHQSAIEAATAAYNAPAGGE
jgi:hypothetical protein